MLDAEFYEWYAQATPEAILSLIEVLQVKAAKFDALVEYGVDNWSGYGDAMQSLE